MEAQRIFQTTLVHPLRPEFSIAAIFAGAQVPAMGGMDALCQSLGIEPLSGGDISPDELRRIVVYLFTGNFETFDMHPRAFLNYINESGIDDRFLAHVIGSARLVTESGAGREDPLARGALGGAPGGAPGGALGGGGLQAQTLGGLLAASLGAELGLFGLSERDRLHDLSGRHHIELLVLLLRDGLLITGSQRGLARALHFGLQERLNQMTAAR